MSDIIYNNIYVTKDYDKFILLDLNRPIHNGAVLNSIEEFNMLPEKPILVTKNMEVLDGQHRLSAAKQLGLEIYYTIARDEVSERHLGKLNTQVNWNLFNFLKLYSKNDRNYQFLGEILERFKCPNYISTLINIIGEPVRRAEANFRSGLFKLRCKEDDCIELVEQIFTLKDTINANVKPFARCTAIAIYALHNIIQAEGYEFEKAKRKFGLSCNKDKLKDAISWSNVTNVEAALKDVYNSRSRGNFLE